MSSPSDSGSETSGQLEIRTNNCECGNPDDYDNLICCDGCDDWYHHKCMDINTSDSERIVEFYCWWCTGNLGLLTTWKGVQATGATLQDKRKHYYDVEEIVASKIRDRKRIFRVKWKGYAARNNTWEPEEHLDGALDILQQYLREHKLPCSTMTALLGASSPALEPEDYNKDNWTSLDEVEHQIRTFRTCRGFQSPLVVERWTKFGQDDAIYLFDFQLHCYVLLWIAKEQFAYIADGANLFKTNKELRDGIKWELGKPKLIPLSFDQQTAVDHCGSSAVLIALTMMNLYKTKDFTQLIVSPRLRAMVISRMHKFPSQKLDSRPIIRFKIKHTCSRCNKHFRTRLQLVTHQRKSPGCAV